MEASGIDMTHFKPHSIQTTSAAATTATTLDVILRIARWPSASTFTNFYKKEIDKSNTYSDSFFVSFHYTNLCRFYMTIVHWTLPTMVLELCMNGYSLLTLPQTDIYIYMFTAVIVWSFPLQGIVLSSFVAS